MRFLSLLIVLGAHLAQAQTARVKTHGGNSGGGGDLTALEPLTEPELEAFIRDEVKDLAAWYFTIFISPTREVGEPDNEISRRLLSPDHDVFSRIKTATLRIQKTPCQDPNTGRARDAAADARTGEVCFSTQSILKRTPSRILRSQVLGLAVHEFSHLVGFDEAAAKQLGDSAMATVSIDGTALANLRDAWFDLRQSLSDVTSLRDLEKNVDSFSSAMVSLRAAADGLMIAKDVEKAWNFISLFTLSPWSPRQRVIAMAAQHKAINLMTFACALPGVADAPEGFGCESSEWFRPGGPNVRRLSDLISDEKKTEFTFGFDMDIRNLTGGNRTDLKLEVQDLIGLLGQLGPQ